MGTPIYEVQDFYAHPNIKQYASSAEQAVPLAQVQELIGIGTPDELALVSDQFGTNFISQATVLFLANAVPADTDTIVLEDLDGNPRSYEFESGGGITGDVSVPIAAGDIDTTMDNLVTAINGDVDADALWEAVAVDLDGINTGGTGKVVVIYRTAQADDSENDVIYGTFATPANCQIVDYTGETDYTKLTTSNLPAAQPSAKNFGFGRKTASLTANETHRVMNEDLKNYVWDSDTGAWKVQWGESQVGLANCANGSFVIVNPAQTDYTMTHNWAISNGNEQKRVDVAFYDSTDDTKIVAGLTNHGANSVDAHFDALPTNGNVIQWTMTAKKTS